MKIYEGDVRFNGAGIIIIVRHSRGTDMHGTWQDVRSLIFGDSSPTIVVIVVVVVFLMVVAKEPAALCWF